MHVLSRLERWPTALLPISPFFRPDIPDRMTFRVWGGVIGNPIAPTGGCLRLRSISATTQLLTQERHHIQECRDWGVHHRHRAKKAKVTSKPLKKAPQIQSMVACYRSECEPRLRGVASPPGLPVNCCAGAFPSQKLVGLSMRLIE